jgi:hypothetical protein
VFLVPLTVAVPFALALVFGFVVPSPWRGLVFLSGVAVAALFIFARPIAGSWSRLGEDVFVLWLTAGWALGFGLVALARLEKRWRYPGSSPR